MTAPPRISGRHLAVTSYDAGEDARRVEIAIRIPSAVDGVQEAVDVVAGLCLASGFDPVTVRFKLRVTLAEALANAIIYGNRLDPGKQVDLQVEVTPTEVAVHVRDEGEGFDPADVPDPTLPERREMEDGRGLYVIRQLADEVQFNDRGNSICMIMRRA
jgi:serine/threonine-protein kinase RsbW